MPLDGWRDRPEFDIVTGVSTGALIAPFVFGGHRFDAALERGRAVGFTDCVAKFDRPGLIAALEADDEG